jgi:hypothetical protein
VSIKSNQNSYQLLQTTHPTHTHIPPPTHSATNPLTLTLPPHVFGFVSKRKKYILKISKNLKKISYVPRRSLLQPEIVKNLLRQRSRFCKDIL